MSFCKRLPFRARADEEAVRGMRSEGELLFALGGRGGPALISRGEDAHGPYVVMARITMPTLRAHTEDGRAGDAAWMARSARALFSRLAEVHEAKDAQGPLGVLHADLSPDNVAIAADGSDARILDFGLARWRDAGLREASAFRGTLPYVAPELARGEPIDARADLFALAASLLHAASGIALRAAPNATSLLLEAAETDPFAWAQEAGRSMALPVRSVLVQCVAFAKDLRPASAAIVANSC